MPSGPPDTLESPFLHDGASVTTDSQRPPIGGQALIEGVLIRGSSAAAMAARTPDGDIVTHSEPVGGEASAARTMPLIRGVLALYDSCVFGVRALYWSSCVATGREAVRPTGREITVAAMTLVLAAVIFIAGPVFLAGWIEPASGSASLEVTAEGLLRIGLLVGYIALVGRLKEVRRVFAYHGAEHRTVHAYERGEPLTVENIREHPNSHPRCGTAFLLTVGVMSLAVYLALGTPPLWERVIERVLLTPLVAGAAYEFIRFTQTVAGHRVLRVLQLPNLWLQKMTTADPDDDQIEVAIAALEAMLAAEEALPAGAMVPVPVTAAAEESG
jgi:uncharacterized protein YqhQ